MGKSAKKLETIRALLAKADGTNFPEEADAFRSKADALMTAYAIEQWQLDAADEADQRRHEPTSTEIDISWFHSSPLKDSLWHMMLNVAAHCRVKLVPHACKRDADWKFVIPAVGLRSDLDYFDMLFSSLYLQMGKQLEPVWNDRLSLGENIQVFKEAGLKWTRIAQLMGEEHRIQPNGQVKGASVWLNAYRKVCKEQGIQPVKTNPATYQRSFAGGFVAGVRSQLERQQAEQGQDGGSMALVLRDIRETINTAAEEMFGKDKRVVRYSRDNRKQDWAAREAGTEAGKKAQVAVHTARRVKNQKQLEG